MGDLLASLLPLFLPNSLEPLRLLDLLLLLLAGGLRLLLPPPLGLLDLERGILSDH